MSDLQKTLSLLPRDALIRWWGANYGNPTEFNYIRVSRASAYTLAAEVALWLGRYEEASNYVNFVIEAGKAPGAAVSWTNQFTGTGFTSYAMFILGYRYVNAYETNRLQEFTSPYPEYGGKYLLKPELSTIEELFYPDKDIDVRWVSWMRLDSKEVIWKYIGKDNIGNVMRDPYVSDAPWLIFKTIDLYLWRGIAENS